MSSSSELRRRVAPPQAGTNERTNIPDKGYTNEKETKDDLYLAPKYLRRWIILYRSCPKLCKIPWTDVDITFALVSASILHVIRLIATPIMIQKVGWPEGRKETLDAVSSVVSMIHAVLLVSSLYFCLFNNSNIPYKPCAKFSETPRWHQEACKALLNLCIGYMLQDMIVCSLLTNYTPDKGFQLSIDDFMFIGHHIITIVYMVSTLIIQSGHFSAMMLMFTGEITNPTFNMYLMSSDAVKLDFCCGITTERYQIIAFVNAATYFFMRAIVGPLVVVHLGYDILIRKEGRTNIPILLGIFFVFSGALVLWGSIPWSKEAWGMVVDALGGKPLSDRVLAHVLTAASISNN